MHGEAVLQRVSGPCVRAQAQAVKGMGPETNPSSVTKRMACQLRMVLKAVAQNLSWLVAQTPETPPFSMVLHGFPGSGVPLKHSSQLWWLP